MTTKQFTYGLIEGFYGRPWCWEDRKACVSFLDEQGFRFYIYAPKTDPYLREKWSEDWPKDSFDCLRRFVRTTQQTGLGAGIGLSPYEINRLSDSVKKQLRGKLMLINEMQPDILCILFDDMEGGREGLAESQVKIFDFIAGISTASSFIVCPTYYSFDPALERIFGKMPHHYLETLGSLLDPAVDIFWTGTQVCSSGYAQSHLSEVTDLLNRRPFIWDNYPVNDSPRMAPYLHLRAFSGRSYRMADWTSGHAVNPMNQPLLSRIPMKTLSMSYHQKAEYSSDAAFNDAVHSLCGRKLGKCIVEDISLFQDRGLNGIEEEEKQALIRRYQDYPSPYAAEIVDWLLGRYTENP